MLLIPKSNTMDNLIKLSEIFKEGFTVEIKNGDISQYNDINKPYVVSYKTILEIHGNTKTFKQMVLHDVDNCVIGGWLDTDTNIYYIEINKTFHNKRLALIFAKQHNQKAIYDSKNREVIEIV